MFHFSLFILSFTSLFSVIFTVGTLWGPYKGRFYLTCTRNPYSYPPILFIYLILYFLFYSVFLSLFCFISLFVLSYHSTYCILLATSMVLSPPSFFPIGSRLSSPRSPPHPSVRPSFCLVRPVSVSHSFSCGVLIALITVAVSTFETLVPTILHGAVSQKAPR
jgi:hypothetical protein